MIFLAGHFCGKNSIHFVLLFTNNQHSIRKSNQNESTTNFIKTGVQIYSLIKEINHFVIMALDTKDIIKSYTVNNFTNLTMNS
jgi:hypothetical protein